VGRTSIRAGPFSLSGALRLSIQDLLELLG
jgi:hypothetical protein